MLLVTRWFGVTGSDAERSLAREKRAEIEEIVEKSLSDAGQGCQPTTPGRLGRGTPCEGCLLPTPQFEVLDVTRRTRPPRRWRARLAKGIFAKARRLSPAIVRFANADLK